VAAQPPRGGRPFLASRLAATPELRRRVETARQLGISLRRLEGWTPKQVTTYEHDDEGRLIKSVTVAESEWDDRERSWMLALQHYELTLCRRCNTPLAESTDPNHDPDNPDAEYHYLADGPDECHACKVLLRADKQWSEYRKDDSVGTGNLIHSLVLVPNTRRRPAGQRGRMQRG
jgi:hypothetical protein